MNKEAINRAVDTVMESFMKPVVFTGVEPLFIVAEELGTAEHLGGVIDAVWVHWDEGAVNEFRYITKFAVQGKILNRDYYSADEVAPYKGRLALPTRENFEKVVRHDSIKEAIKAVKAEQHALELLVRKDFETIDQALGSGQEVTLFKRAYGELSDSFFNIDIEAPYTVVDGTQYECEAGEYALRHPKTGEVKKYVVADAFHAYIIGGRAEVAGMRLKDEGFKARIAELKLEARDVLTGIEWLSLDDPKVVAIKESLPRHPFDSYFHYVGKGEERKVDAPAHLIRALEIIIEEHMPQFIGPLGAQYIPIDNLLYLFHAVVPRPDALAALEACDVVHEPSGLVLGFEGQREVPPKFLVSIAHVAAAYGQFPAFVEACERYLEKAKS